jgi:heptosyltransferase-1
MRVLVIKTSSLGDVIHTLPALTDAMRAYPGIHFDWVVEEAFAEIPKWHPAVDRVIPVAIRRWRKNPLKAWFSGEWKHFRLNLREREYDYVIDAQGLVKSAFITRRARGQKHGLDKASAREPRASKAYDYTHFVARNQHAIRRVRKLFADTLRYPMPEDMPDYGIDLSRLPGQEPQPDYAVFLHGTTWETKHWPEEYWIELAKKVTGTGLEVHLPWGNEVEHVRAQKIAEAVQGVEVLPAMGIPALAAQLSSARFVVGVDTGLAHLCAALSVPSITLYGPTSPGLTGVMGASQKNLEVDFECAPCFSRKCRFTDTEGVLPKCFTSLTPEKVWQQVQLHIGSEQDTNASNAIT